MKAEILNRQFVSAFTAEGNTAVPVVGASTASVIETVHVSCRGVTKLLRNLKSHKVIGPDDIPARLLKEAAAEIAPAVTHLFQASLDQGKVRRYRGGKPWLSKFSRRVIAPQQQITVRFHRHRFFASCVNILSILLLVTILTPMTSLQMLSMDSGKTVCVKHSSCSLLVTLPKAWMIKVKQT